MKFKKCPRCIRRGFPTTCSCFEVIVKVLGKPAQTIEVPWEATILDVALTMGIPQNYSFCVNGMNAQLNRDLCDGDYITAHEAIKCCAGGRHA